MAAATVAPSAETVVDVAIVGGGICGILAASRCRQEGLRYVLIERNPALGGNWTTMANSYSKLQAYEPMYRWDGRYRLSADPFSQNSAERVRERLQEFARDEGVRENAWLGTEVLDVTRPDPETFELACRAVAGREAGPAGGAPPPPAARSVRASFVCVTCGLLGEQLTAEDRGVTVSREFPGVVTLAGAHRGEESRAGDPATVAGRRVVVMGSGSFAAEAAEAAVQAGAEHVTMLSRPRYRWVLPFSRQFTFLAVSFLPLVPWRWKIAFVGWYLRRYVYGPSGLAHWLPDGEAAEMDYSGQSNDGIFRLAAAGKLTALVDRPVAVGPAGVAEAAEAGPVAAPAAAGPRKRGGARGAAAEGLIRAAAVGGGGVRGSRGGGAPASGAPRPARGAVTLASGGSIPCDVFVVASGCAHNGRPAFLRTLGLGFADLHSYAFLGRNPRIGTASDFVFAFVPAGPAHQLDMFFAAVRTVRAGREAEAEAALEPTALPDLGHGLSKGGGGCLKGGRMAGDATWFETRHWWSAVNIAIEDRTRVYMRVVSLDKGIGGRLWLRSKMLVRNFAICAVCSALAAVELATRPVIPRALRGRVGPR